jgi:hypothetical protein
MIKEWIQQAFVFWIVFTIMGNLALWSITQWFRYRRHRHFKYKMSRMKYKGPDDWTKQGEDWKDA